MPTTIQEFTSTSVYVPIDPPGDSSQVRNRHEYRSTWTKAGTNRPKPKSWMPPSEYLRTSRHFNSALGVACHIENARDGSKPAFVRSLVGDISTGNPVDGFISIPSTQQNLLNAALTDMRDQKFNLLTSLAELNKSLSHLGSVATRLTSAVRDVKAMRFTRAASRLGIVKPKGASRSKSWASNWLEYKYGWMPLIYDAYGIAEHLASHSRSHAPVFRARKRARDTQTSYVEGSTTINTFTVRWLKTIEKQASREVIVYYQVDMSSVQSLSRLGLTDPAATMWELVPFSFVADWFLPIGNWLSMMNSWVGLIHKGSCHTTVTRNHAFVHYSGVSCRQEGPNTISLHGEQIHPGSNEVFAVQRSLIRDPNYRLVGKIPANFGQAISSIALLRQQFK